MFDWLRVMFGGGAKEGTVLGAELVQDSRMLGALQALSMQNGRPVRVHSVDGSRAAIEIERLSPNQTAEAAGRSNLFPGVTYFEGDGRTEIDTMPDYGEEGGIRRLIVNSTGAPRKWFSNKILSPTSTDES